MLTRHLKYLVVIVALNSPEYLEKPTTFHCSRLAFSIYTGKRDSGEIIPP